MLNAKTEIGAASWEDVSKIIRDYIYICKVSETNSHLLLIDVHPLGEETNLTLTSS